MITKMSASEVFNYNRFKVFFVQDLYYRFNDDKLKWIAKSNWKYTRNFKPDKEIMNSYEQWLIFEGVDTITTIRLNGVKLGITSNMFQTYVSLF